MFRPAALLSGATLAALSSSALFAQFVPANSPIVQLDPLTVLAHPTGADERAASVWVLTRDAGSATPPLRVADWLASVPGVHVDQPGGAGGRATLYLRGAEENFAAVFLDGVPLSDPTNSRGGAVDLSLLEPALLRTAAIVRGPASVRYGPEALAGTVHFSTTDAAEVPAYVAVEYGGDHFLRGSGSETRALENRAGFAGLAVASHDEGRREDGSRVERRYGRASYVTGQRVKTRVVAWHAQHEADGYPDDSGGAQFAASNALEHRENRQSAVSLQVEESNTYGSWSFSADAAQFDATVLSPGVAPGVRDPFGIPASTDETRLRRYRASTMVDRWVGRWKVATGVDAQREEGESAGSLDFGGFLLPTSFALDRTRVGAFAETSGKIRRLTIVAGARVDRYEDSTSDDALTRGTARLGTFLPLTKSLTWRAQAGTAFKPASFYALANPLVGNPALKPERARTWETGLRQTFASNRALLDVTYFDSRFKDGIDFDPGPPPQLVNRAGIRSRGAEAAFSFSPSGGWTVGASATYTDARSEPGDLRMRLRPRWRGAFSATWQPQPRLSLAARFVAVGDLPDTSVPTGDVTLGGWARLDLSASWKFNDTLELTAAVDNALDRAYAEAVGFPSPGRRLRTGIRAQF